MEQEVTQEGMVEDVSSQAVSNEPESVSAETPKSYTEEEIKVYKAAQAKADADLYKVRREAEDYKTKADSLSNELGDLQSQLDGKLEELLGEDDGKQAARVIRDYKVKIGKVEARAKQLEVEHEEFYPKAWSYLNAIQKLSSAYGVDASLLSQFPSYDEAEEFAKKIKAERQKGTAAKTSSSFVPDIGISDVGGQRSFTVGQIDSMSSEEYEKNLPAIEQAQREGRIK